MDLSIPYIQVRDSRKALARVAAHFYGNPSHSLLMIGVTGTSGKTTTTYLIESILKAAGHEVGVIGTVNFRYGSKIFDSTHTTPAAVELQRLLSEMKFAGCTAVVMEVSSHSLKQHRTSFIAFDGMVFTNLSPEHLDFHTDMDDYFRSKSILFTDMVEYSVSVGKKPYGAVNVDDEYGTRLCKDLETRPYPGFSFGRFGQRYLSVSLAGIQGKVGEIEVRSALAGQFNAYNILAGLEVTRGLGIQAEAISAGIENLRLVPGRLERVPNAKGVHVFVDYAHKPDALEKVLRTLREVRGPHRLLTVFGCGGDRDRKKRPVMGKIAVELSDYVYVTSDNPRTENPEAIISEILAGIPQEFSNYRVESDRKKAIFAAIEEAKTGDLVVIAGKGHENYQIIADSTVPGGTRKIHFDDREVALEALGH
jgi:UDP-N-acetylmuramyl-tripeptide synthetase